jgi:uncharacterized protein (DUF433 family)
MRQVKDDELLKRIEVNPRVMLGKPVIRGTRIPVEQVLRKLAQDITPDEIVADFPRLTLEDIRAALAYAALALSTEEFLPLELEEMVAV